MARKQCITVLAFCNGRCPCFFHNFEDGEAIWCSKLEKKIFDAPKDGNVPLIIDTEMRNFPDDCPLEDFK